MTPEEAKARLIIAQAKLLALAEKLGDRDVIHDKITPIHDHYSLSEQAAYEQGRTDQKVECLLHAPEAALAARDAEWIVAIEELFNGWYGLKELSPDSSAPGDFRLAIQALSDEMRGGK